MLIVLFLVLVPAPALAADEVELANGDRLSGEIVEKSGDKLVLRTEYAGDVSIRWNAVASIRTDYPVRALLRNADEPVYGQFSPRLDGRIELVPAPGSPPADFTIDDIAFLNPKPYETAHGIEYKGRTMVSAAATRGNAESERLYGEGEFTARARQYRYSLNGKIEHRDEPLGTVTASNWLLAANYDRFLDPKHFAYTRASLENDRFKDIDRRSTLGGGYGLQLVETERTNISVRGGLDYVVLQRFSGRDERFPAFGWGIKINYKPPFRNLELFHDEEGYWNLRDTSSITLRSKSGLRVPVIDRLKAVAQINVDWERKPSPGRKPTDSTLLFGLDYNW